MKLLFKLIPTGMVLPILKGTLKGKKWILGAAAGEAKGISVLFANPEETQLSLVHSVLKPTDIAFDLGANVGLYTLLFASTCKKTVAFEPVPRNISFLYRLIALNNLNNCSIVPLAVSNTSELTSFNESDNCAIGKIDSHGKMPVQSITLDKFCKYYNIKPTVIKIDVEGAEINALIGAKNILTNKPKLFISFHSESLRKQGISLLKQFGYSYKEISSVGEGSEYFFFSK